LLTRRPSSAPRLCAGNNRAAAWVCFLSQVCPVVRASSSRRALLGGTLGRFDKKDPALEAYFEDINRFPVLSRQEEFELAHRARAGDEAAAKRLAEANLRFVVKVALRYSNQGLPLADLISAGNEGLLIALRHFEPERGNRLISYGIWWIKQSIRRVLSSDSRTIRLPLYVYCDLYRLKRAGEALAKRHGRRPTIAELADETGIIPERLERTLRLSTRLMSLNRPISPGEGTEMVELLADPRSEDPELLLMLEDRRRELERLLAKLPRRQRRVVEMHYGIGGEPLTLRQIGEKLGLSRERVRQLEAEAFHRIRRAASRTPSRGRGP